MPWHWSDQAQKKKDFEFLLKFKDDFMESISSDLNKYHSLEFTTKSWDVVLGFWVWQLNVVLFDRLRLLGLDRIDPQQIGHVEELLEDLRPRSLREANSNFNSEVWNTLFLEVLNQGLRGVTSVSLDNEAGSLMSKLRSATGKKYEMSRLRPKYLLSLVMMYVWNNWCRRLLPRNANQIVVVSMPTAIPILVILKLLWRHKRFFIFFPNGISPKATLRQNNNQVRFKINLVNCKGSSPIIGFEKLVCAVGSKLVPSSILDNFERHITLGDCFCSKYDPPNSMIFSSHAHFHDDAFKIWAAQKIYDGSKLVLGQHGSGVFPDYSGSRSYELGVADRYITTGNGNQGSEKLVDCGQYWARVEPRQHNPKGPVLVVFTTSYKWIHDLRSTNHGPDFYLDIERLIDLLSAFDRNKVRAIVRLHRMDFNWEIRAKIQEKLPDVVFDGDRAFSRSLKSASAVVVLYNGSTYNEALWGNVPTFICWDPDSWRVADYGLKDFEELSSVGIFHDSTSSLVKFLSSRIGKLDSWWFSEEVQKQVKVFSDKYCRRAYDLAGELNRALHFDS